MTRTACSLVLALALFCPAPAPCAQVQTQAQAPAPNAPQAPPALSQGVLQEAMDQLFLSQEWQAKNNLDAARRAAQDALAAIPGDPFARIRLAQIDAASGNFQAARDALDEVLKADPGNLLALIWQGHLLLWQAHYEESFATYSRALALAPSNGWASLGAAAALLAKDAHKQAAPFLAKAQASAGDDADLHLALGETFARLGLMANARLELERSMELTPRGTRTLVSAGEVYQRMGQESLAMDAWRQALALEPANARARFDLMTALGRQADRAMAAGDGNGAVRMWRTMLSYDPLDQTALDRLRSLPR